MIRRIAIVTPVLDDWDSFIALTGEIAQRFKADEIVFHLVAVDDGSNAPLDLATLPLPADGAIASVEILRLVVNLGHQRAIAVGLCAIAERKDIDAVIVMDCDGEDRPIDIANLLAAGERYPLHVAVAHRTKRSETRTFRFLYAAYKLLFHILIGRTINFGNYSLIPMSAVQRLVHMPELWNNLAAAILRSRLRYLPVPTIRGRRYAGRSRMNLVSLIVHGLSAMSVYSDAIFVRTLIAAAFIAMTSIFGIISIAAIRFATDLAIPGWATTVVGDLLIILMQTVVIVVATSLMMLAGRSNRPIIPAVDARVFIAGGDRQKITRTTVAAVDTLSARAS